MKTKELLQLGGVIVAAVLVGNVLSHLAIQHVLPVTKPKA
jgi:hypothetical protein